MMPLTDTLPIGDKTRPSVCVTNPLDDAAFFRSEAAGKVNPASCGLSSRFFTRDIDRMFRVADALETDMIGINDCLELETPTFNSSI